MNKSGKKSIFCQGFTRKMEINNIYDKYFIKFQHNINFAVFKTINLKMWFFLDIMRSNFHKCHISIDLNFQTQCRCFRNIKWLTYRHFESEAISRSPKKYMITSSIKASQALWDLITRPTRFIIHNPKLVSKVFHQNHNFQFFE